MEYKTYIKRVIKEYKCASIGDEYRTIPIYEDGELRGFLKPVTYLYKIIKPTWPRLICQWRIENELAFANRFVGTEEKTINWLDNILLPRADRILFMVCNVDNIPIGHLGYSCFDFVNRSCEIDNVVRGVKEGNKGLMSSAMNTILKWGRDVLELDNIYLKVLSDNKYAIKFYKRLGFIVKWYIPLYKVEKPDITEWVEDQNSIETPDKFFIYMQYVGE